MTYKPEVSIIIPIFNVEKYLDKCISSIVMQTWENIEIILVDDGSSDECASICDKYECEDARIKVIHKSNGGLVSARKAGMVIAKGDYIVNVDGDDWIEPNMVEKLLKRITEDHSDVVQCGIQFEGDRSKLIRYEDFVYDVNDSNRNAILTKWMQDRSGFDSPVFTKIFEKSFFIKIYSLVPDTIRRAEDFVSYIETIRFARRLSSINDILIHYRIREDSLSHARNVGEQIVSVDESINHIYRVVKNSNEFREFPDNELEKWVVRNKLSSMYVQQKKDAATIHRYKLKKIDNLIDKKIVLYGAGAVGKDFYSQIVKYSDIKLVAWIDKHYEKYRYEFAKVCAPEYIKSKDFDLILIAVMDQAVAKQIKSSLKEDYSVSDEKIIWQKPTSLWDDFSSV